MPPFHQPRPRLPLLLIQHRQQPENHRDARIQLHAHQTVRGSVGNVFEVHGFAFYEDADGDDGVEGGGGREAVLERVVDGGGFLGGVGDSVV